MDNITYTQYNLSSHAITFDNVRAGWEQYVLLHSDQHIDCTSFHKKAFHDNLKRAMKLNAPILGGGDIGAAMQTNSDPRRSYNQMRPELLGDDYVNRMIDLWADEYQDYSDNMTVFFKGNHETAMQRKINVDLMRMFKDEMVKRNPNTPLGLGGYEGHVIFNFNIRKTVRQRVEMRFFHGAGGGGRSTRGVTNANFRASYSHSDIFWTGHIHHCQVTPIKRERISKQAPYNTEYYIQSHITTPSYQSPHEIGDTDGFQIEKELAPRPVGCVWLRFHCDGEGVKMTTEIDVQ